jgi:3-hydroxyacyl-[acyl-carrier-protein] dehydratase
VRYLLIDRIQRLERDKRVLATKNVALSEDIFAEHFVGAPVMPGALLIESLAQAGTALLEVSADYEKKAILLMVKTAKFRSMVRPGDQLAVSMEVASHDADTTYMEGTVRRGDEVVATADLIFGLKDASQFYPEKKRFLVEAVYDVWLRDAELIGF